MTNHRPTWSETWLGVARIVAARSLCINSQVGAVIVSSDSHVEETGYNGPPAGLSVDGPCSRWCPTSGGGGSPDYSACASVHAELNALLRADATAIEDGTIYVTRAPCMNCAKAIANSGLAQVVCARTEEDSHAEAVFAYLERCGLEARYA